MNNKVKIIEAIPAEKAALRSNSNRYVIGGIDPTTPLNLANPDTHAMILKSKIPIMILPLTFIFSKTIMNTKVAHARSTKGFLISPKVTNVTG